MKKVLLVLFILININLFSKTITLVYDDWYPYCYTINEKAVGFDIEVIESVINIMGFEVDFIRTDWENCLPLAKSGEVDGVVSLLKIEDRTNYLIYPKESISRSITKLWSKYRNYKVTKYSRLGKVESYSYIGNINNLNVNRLYFNTEYEMMLALKGGSIDLIYEDLLIVNNLRKEYKIDLYSIDFSGNGLFNFFLNKPDDIYVAFSKNSNNIDENFTYIFNKELRAFKKTVAYRNILKEYVDYKDMQNYLNLSRAYYPMFFIVLLCLLIIVVSYKTLKYNHLNIQSLFNYIIGLALVYSSNMFPLEDLTVYVRILGLVIISTGSHKYIQRYFNNKTTINLYSLCILVCTVLSVMFKEVSYIHLSIFIITSYFIMNILYDFNVRKYLIALPTALLFVTFTILTGLARANMVIYYNWFLVIFIIGFLCQVADTFYINYYKKKVNND